MLWRPSQKIEHISIDEVESVQEYCIIEPIYMG